MDSTIYVAKTKALTAKLICHFVFAYAKSRFSHDAVRIILVMLTIVRKQHILRMMSLLSSAKILSLDHMTGIGNLKDDDLQKHSHVHFDKHINKTG